MRIRDRGIGNIAFIMVLVVMLVALALYIMEADKNEGLVTAAALIRFQSAALVLLLGLPACAVIAWRRSPTRGSG